LHFVVKRLSVFFYLLKVNVSPWGQDIIVFADVLNVGRLAKTRNVFVLGKLLFASPLVVNVGNIGNVVVC